MKKLVIALLCGTLSVSAFANLPSYKTLSDEKAAFELCNNAAVALNNDTLHISPALDMLKPYLGRSEDDIELARVNHQFFLLKVLETNIGKPVEAVHIDTKKTMKDTFMTHEFLLKRENYAIGFACKFYQPKTNGYWKLALFSISEP